MAILIYAAEHPELPPIKVHFLNVKMSITVIATVNELLLQHLIGVSNWIFLGESLHLIRSLTVKMEDFTRNTRPFKRRTSILLTYINIELTETPPATGFTQNTTPLSCAQRIRAPKTRIGKCQNKTTPKEVAGMFYAEPLAPLRSLKLLPFHLH